MGYDKGDEKRILMCKGTDIKLKRNKMFNLLVSQPFFIYICRAIYNN